MQLLETVGDEVSRRGHGKLISYENQDTQTQGLSGYGF